MFLAMQTCGRLMSSDVRLLGYLGLAPQIVRGPPPKADKTKETAPLALSGRAQLCSGQTRVASCSEICSSGSVNRTKFATSSCSFGYRILGGITLSQYSAALRESHPAVPQN